jgi:hypothetical protein
MAPAEGDLAERLENLDYDLSMVSDLDNPSVGTHEVVAKLIRSHGLNIAPGTPAYWQLDGLVRRAFIEGARRSIQRTQGDFGGTAHDPMFTAAGGVAVASDAAPGISFAQLIERYENDPSRSVTAKTKANRAGMLGVLKEIIGESRPTGQITRADARRVQDSLLALPAHAAKRFPGLPISKIVERARSEKIPPMAPATVNAHIGLLSEVLRWGVRESLIGNNVADGLQVPDTPAKDKRRSFKPDELEKFFHSLSTPEQRCIGWPE